MNPMYSTILVMVCQRRPLVYIGFRLYRLSELGLLVWQDFQFACGVYPAHDSFVDSVREEAEQNVKRLRHHPAMALFCGNNSTLR